MKTIAFHLQKGGVGKTSLSCSAVYELAKKGKVCLIDGDPQGNSSSWLTHDGKKISVKAELAEVLSGIDVKEALVQIRGNIFLIPTFGLTGKLKTYGETQLNNEPYIFTELNELLEKEGFDFVVYDLSPGFGRLEKCILMGVQSIITPLMADVFSLDGIEIFTTELNKLKKSFRVNPNHDLIIINSYNKSIKQNRDILSSIPEGFNKLVFPTDPAYRKAQEQGVFIRELTGSDKPKESTIEQLDALREVI